LQVKFLILTWLKVKIHSLMNMRVREAMSLCYAEMCLCNTANVHVQYITCACVIWEVVKFVH